jgi:transcriptional regulator with XRE-family HTH domain
MELSKKEKELLTRMGEVLRKLRKDAGFSSYEDFANHIGMETKQYGDYERGLVNISYITLYRLLSHHGLRIDEFDLLVFSEHRTKDSKIIQMKNNTS